MQAAPEKAVELRQFMAILCPQREETVTSFEPTNPGTASPVSSGGNQPDSHMSDHPNTRETRNHSREIKFLIDATTARAVRDWARASLSPDIHGGGPSSDEYQTATLYFDTDDFDVFHRRGSYGRSKYRIRRYGVSDVVFFERKLRTRDLLVKRRTAAGIHELPRLSFIGGDETWPPNWFHQRLQVRNLAPICRVAYHRTARVGLTPYGTMRLTLDDRLIATPTDVLAFGGEAGTPVVPDQTVLELKFRVEMPALFKQLAEKFNLVPQQVSKYRLAVTALGLATPESAPAAPAPSESSRA